MTPNEYQKLAQRTQTNMKVAQARINDLDADFAVGLLHAAVGIAGESGELATAVEKWLFYGQILDNDNLKEELGDLLWYIAEACNAAGISLEEVMAGNIAKLKKRYPDKYSDERALEENRDRESEMKALNGTVEDAKRRMAAQTHATRSARLRSFFSWGQ